MVERPEGAGFFDAGGLPLFSLGEINRLGRKEKEEIYKHIVPERVFTAFGIERSTLCGKDGLKKIHFICPEGLGLLRTEVRLHPHDRDCLFFVEIVDTPYQQIELSFCLINDLSSMRYDVDADQAGRDNCFATLRRNIPEELRAMRAGLAPNQVRRGLKMFSQFFAQFERFVAALGRDTITAEPLSYDNAVRYEGYGFDYLTGKKLMCWIDREFRPGGILYRQLDGSTPFRRRGTEKSVRGRSWAIHDGILGFPWNGVKIYKTIGAHAGVNTFPDREY